MIILKVKEWLKNPKAQFRVKKEFDGVIDSVTRLIDGEEFERNHFYEMADNMGVVKIEKFESDLVGVEIHVDYFYGTRHYKLVKINSIVLHKDGKVNINIERRPRKRVVAKKKSNDNDNPEIYSI